LWPQFNKSKISMFLLNCSYKLIQLLHCLFKQQRDGDWINSFSTVHSLSTVHVNSREWIIIHSSYSEEVESNSFSTVHMNLFMTWTGSGLNLNALDWVRPNKIKKSNKISQALCFIRKTSGKYFSMTLHNYIRRRFHDDVAFVEFDRNPNFIPNYILPDIVAR
jgi:hypothetical protein